MPISGELSVSVDLASCPSSSATLRLPLGRWFGLTALLFLEGTVLASRLGSVSPLDKGLWLSYAIGHRYAVLRLVIATATAILLFGGRRLWQEFHKLSEEGKSYTPWWPWYLAHLATFTATATLLIPVLERDPRFFPFRGAGTILLAVVGLASLA